MKFLWAICYFLLFPSQVLSIGAPERQGRFRTSVLTDLRIPSLSGLVSGGRADGCKSLRLCCPRRPGQGFRLPKKMNPMPAIRSWRKNRSMQTMIKRNCNWVPGTTLASLKERSPICSIMSCAGGDSRFPSMEFVTAEGVGVKLMCRDGIIPFKEEEIPNPDKLNLRIIKKGNSRAYVKLENLFGNDFVVLTTDTFQAEVNRVLNPKLRDHKFKWFRHTFKLVLTEPLEFDQALRIAHLTFGFPQFSGPVDTDGIPQVPGADVLGCSQKHAILIASHNLAVEQGIPIRFEKSSLEKYLLGGMKLKGDAEESNNRDREILGREEYLAKETERGQRLWRDDE